MCKLSSNGLDTRDVKIWYTLSININLGKNGQTREMEIYEMSQTRSSTSVLPSQNIPFHAHAHRLREIF